MAMCPLTLSQRTFKKSTQTSDIAGSSAISSVESSDEGEGGHELASGGPAADDSGPAPGGPASAAARPATGGPAAGGPASYGASGARNNMGPWFFLSRVMN